MTEPSPKPDDVLRHARNPTEAQGESVEEGKGEREAV